MTRYSMRVSQIEGDLSVMVELESTGPKQAQENALHWVFDTFLEIPGWHRIRVSVPEEVTR